MEGSEDQGADSPPLNLDDFRGDIEWLLDRAGGLGVEGGYLLRAFWFQRNRHRMPEAADIFDRLVGDFEDAARNLSAEEVATLDKIVEDGLPRK